MIKYALCSQPNLTWVGGLGLVSDSSALYHHHQNTKWGFFLWRMMLNHPVRVPETWNIYTKEHWSFFSWGLWWFKILSSMFFLFYNPRYNLQSIWIHVCFFIFIQSDDDFYFFLLAARSLVAVQAARAPADFIAGEVCQLSVTLVVETDVFPPVCFSHLTLLSFKKLSHHVSFKHHCC